MRLRFIRIILLLFGAFLAAPRAGAAGQPPNIVLIISDDHGWTDYGFMGHPHIQTPNLDRLAARSRVFPRGYVPASLCSPSLASILTGKYPHQHKVVCNDPPVPDGMTRRQFYGSQVFRYGRARLSQFIEEQPTLPGVLGTAGYLSLQTGKWWMNDYSTGGFTHGMTHGNEDQGGRHGDEGLEIGREGLEPIYEFMAAAAGRERPFFVWYAPFLPHRPHNPPERLLSKYREAAPSIHVARYWAMVEWFDETCGELLEHLELNGLAENTIVAYVADNGWIQSVDEPGYAPRSKQSPYDGGLRTPIMLHWPGRIAPERIEAAVSSIDLMPALLKLAGVEAPENLPGIDLMDGEAVRGREAVFGECYTHDCVDLTNPARGLRWRWTVRGDWKLILPAPQNEEGPPELYHITEDPFEENNLAAEQPERVRELTNLLNAWWRGEP